MTEILKILKQSQSWPLAKQIIDAVTQLPPKPKFSKAPQILIVGGAVRDANLHLVAQDFDLEVYGVDAPDLELALEKLFPQQVNKVGQTFGIFNVRRDQASCDIALARTETKTGLSHRDFEINSSPDLDYTAAFGRRDFTINALGFDPVTEILIDPYQGQTDLDKKILKMVDAKTFADDPLRVYRALQLAARFQLKVAPATQKVFKNMVAANELENLSSERITAEWKKLLLAEQPSLGLTLAKAIGLIEKYEPELFTLIGIPQEPEWHPEGDVWTHTLMTLDAAKYICDHSKYNFDQNQRLIIALGSLCHDLGKPMTTQVIEGRIRSRGHEQAGIALSSKFLSRKNFGQDTNNQVLKIVADHLKPGAFKKQLKKGDLTESSYKSAARKLLRRLNPVDWRVFLAVSEADSRGRAFPNALTQAYSSGELFETMLATSNIVAEAKTNLISGLDILNAAKELEVDLRPGPIFSKIIQKIEALRDQDQIQNQRQALEVLKKIIKDGLN